MRRLSYPAPAKPCDHSVMTALYMTASRLETGILHELKNGHLVMAGISEGLVFVVVDDGENTTERSFEQRHEAVRHLMNLAAYAA